MPRYTAKKILALRAGNSLPGTTRNVTVTANGGRTASVDWSDDLSQVTLNMPSLPPDAVLTRAEADRLVAFIGHECCHVLHSDRAAWRRAIALGKRVQDWTNALEDVRIERKEIEAGAFPALGGLLAGMANHLHYEAVIESRKHGRTIGAEVRDAVYASCILGRVANGYPIPAAAGLEGDLSLDARRLVNVALVGLSDCRSTDDVVTLAEKLVAMEPPPEPKAPPSQPDDSSREGPEGDDGPDGSREGPEGDDGPDGSREGPEGDDGEGEGEGASPSTEADLTKAVDAIAKRAGIDDLDTHNETATAYGLSVVPTKVSAPRLGAIPGGEHAAAAKALSDRLPRNSLLHGQIGRLLVSAEVRGVTHHESSGRLDRRALARMQTGAADVFSRREDTPGIDTALMILIDGSVSMRAQVDHVNSRMDVAQTAAWHIARAAESANAKVCVASFHTMKSRSGDWIPGADVKVIKPWEVAMTDRAAHLAAEQPGGGTPLSPAIMRAATILADVGATRRVLMVLTDGECDFGADGVTRACALATDMGIETVGIGMDCPSVTAAFPPHYSVNVENLHQLATTGLGVLVRMLEDANPRAGGND